MAYYTFNPKMTKVFFERLCFNFHTHCEEEQLTPDLENFLAYLIDQELVGKSDIKRYAIREAFKQYYPADGACTKEEAVGKLAKRFSLSEKGAWRLLQRML